MRSGTTRGEREIDDSALCQSLPKQLVLFRVGGLRLGIDTQLVREVTRAIPVSVPLPNAGYITGLITLRGDSTAVIDLGRVLGVPREQEDRQAKMIAVSWNDTTICLLVDRVDGLHDLKDADLEPPPAVVTDMDIRWLDHITRSQSGELIGVIDLDRILSRVSIPKTEV